MPYLSGMARIQPGARVAERYTLERELAAGGMGAVYVAVDEKFHTRVALKVAAAAGATYHAFQTRFAREARIGNRLGRVQNIVRAFDWGVIEDGVSLYLVMDLIEDSKPLDLVGGTLEERLVRLYRAVRLVAEAHRHGVVHRDLKPANFLQGPDGSVYLTDFGLAKAPDEPDPTGVEVTASESALGTPRFMPPEQFEDARAADERVDVYALGVMLYLALTNSYPFDGAPTTILKRQMAVLGGHSRLATPSDLNPDAPQALCELCMRALALEREERLPQVQPLLDTLEAHLGPDAVKAPAIRVSSGRLVAQPGAVPDGALDPTLIETPMDVGRLAPTTADTRPTTLAAPASEAPTLPATGSSLGDPVRGALWPFVLGALLLVGAGALAMFLPGTDPDPVAELPPEEPPPEEPPPEELPPEVSLQLDLPPDQAILGDSLVKVSGLLSDALPGTEVRVMGVSVPLRPDGGFGTTQRLSEGAQVLELVVTRDGKELLRLERPVTIDQTPPRLRIIHPPDGMLSTRRTLEARGTLVDDGPWVEVLVDGEVRERVEGGGSDWTAQIPLEPGENTVFFSAQDAAGNKAETIEVVVRRMEDDHGNCVEEATPLQVDGEALAFEYEYLGDQDWFALELEGGRTYELRTSELVGGLDPHLTFLDRDGETVLDENDDSPDNYVDSYNSLIDLKPQVSGTYYAFVRPLTEDETGEAGEAGEAGAIALRLFPLDDFGDTREDATRLAESGQARGVLLRGDVDMFAVELEAGVIYTCETLDLAPRLDTRLRVYGVDGTQLFENDDRADGEPRSVVRFVCATSGVHHVAVENAAASHGEYSLRVFDNQDRHGDDAQAASPLELEQPVQAGLQAAQDEDWFRLQLTGGARYWAWLEVDGARVRVQLLDAAGTVVKAGASENNDWFVLDLRPEADGEYFLVVREADGQQTLGTYRLTVYVTPQEHGGSLEEASALTIDEPLFGAIETPGDLDYFSVELSPGATWEVSVEGDDVSLDTVLTVLDSGGQQLRSNDDDPEGPPGYRGSRVELSPTTPEVYFLQVRHYDTTGIGARYRVRVTKHTGDE
jgi:serine/threonine protein kinase